MSTTKRIKVNGQMYCPARETIDYETLVSFADKTGNPSVVVSYGKCASTDGKQHPDRCLLPGESCPCVDLMIVSVHHTGSA